MWTHDDIWDGIDAVAERRGLSVSGLARLAGLDPTTFNRSKRFAPDGRPRWPSTESLSKVMASIGAEPEDVVSLLALQDAVPLEATPLGLPPSIPLLGMAQAGAGGFFDSAGYPVGQGLDEVELPSTADNSYALRVTGDSMMPLYRAGDIIVVSPAASIKRGDRVVVRTHAGEVMAKTLRRITQNKIELESLNPAHPVKEFTRIEVDWIARILWATQ